MTALAAVPGSTAELTRIGRRRMFFALALGVGLSGCAVHVDVVPEDVVAIERHEVLISASERPSVLTGFLLGGDVADLAEIYVDRNDERRLRIHAFADGHWTPALDATLRPGVSFVDVAEIGGRDRLISYEPGRLNWFDPESATEHELVAVTDAFRPPRRLELPHVDVSHDLNGDGRDDLVVPASVGFQVFIQGSAGAFADPVRIGPPTDLAGISGAGGYRYDPWRVSRVHELDHDGDGRGDLVFWNDDHFEAHLQDERGLFDPEAESFTTEVAFDSDDPFSLAGGDMAGRVLHSLADLDGDGVADLVVFELEGTRTSRKRSRYQVHFGTRASDGRTAFARDVAATFQSEGRIQIGMERKDLDRDGDVDLMFTTIALDSLQASPWKSLKGFMGDDIKLQLEFHRMEAGRYSDTPHTVRTAAFDGIPSHQEPGSVSLDIVLRGATHASRMSEAAWPGAFNSTLILGDVTGDGLTDLLLGSHPQYLGLYVGVLGPDLFARAPQSVRVDVPNDQEYVWLVDLDRDGALDILMHLPVPRRDAHGTPLDPPGAEAHRVTILMAR